MSSILRRFDRTALLACASLALAACVSSPRRVEIQGEFLRASGPRFPPGPVPYGQPVPRFELFDLDGKLVRLEDFEGRVVVLEWFNPDCPFVRDAHARGTLKDTPAALVDDGVVWLAINSAGEGKHGADPNASRVFANEHDMEFPILLDPKGEIGRAFGAERTPQIFVLDTELRLAWSGPPDDAPFGKVKGGARPELYVEEAVAAVLDGRRPLFEVIPAYGCAVKYAYDASRPRGF